MDIRDQDDNLNPHPEHMANMSDARELAQLLIKFDARFSVSQMLLEDWSKIMKLARAILA